MYDLLLKYVDLEWFADSSQLFFNKRSQFVSGVEAEKEAVCTGQKVSNPCAIFLHLRQTNKLLRGNQR